MLSIIVAMSENHVIGSDGALPWHLPADLAHFKRTTMGCPVIMGRKTFESLDRPLPGRRNVLVTRNPDYFVDGVEVAHTLDEAIKLAAADNDNEHEEVFVLGGEELFRLALPRADRLYLTLVHAELEGDTHFPLFDLREWKLLESLHHAADDRHEYACTFHVFERIR